MKRHQGLFQRLCDPAFLLEISRQTCRGKRRRPDVALHLHREESTVGRLAQDLRQGTWEPAGFDRLFIRDPKPRVIARAPVRDRLVHSALVALMEPVWAPVLVPGDMACWKGRGVHRALLALQGHMRKHRFVLHLDIRAYFPSVDPQRLLPLVQARIDDPEFLRALEQVLASGTGLLDDPTCRAWARLSDDWPPKGRGLPVGAQTSQFLATHAYLGQLDSWAMRSLRVGAWMRYVDDIFIFGHRRESLRHWRSEIAHWLLLHRDLRLKHPQAPVLACAGSLDALGQRVYRDRICSQPGAWRRLRRTLRRAHGEGALAPWRPVVAGRLGSLTSLLAPPER